MKKLQNFGEVLDKRPRGGAVSYGDDFWKASNLRKLPERMRQLAMAYKMLLDPRWDSATLLRVRQVFQTAGCTLPHFGTETLARSARNIALVLRHVPEGLWSKLTGRLCGGDRELAFLRIKGRAGNLCVNIDDGEPRASDLRILLDGLEQSKRPAVKRLRFGLVRGTGLRPLICMEDKGRTHLGFFASEREALAYLNQNRAELEERARKAIESTILRLDDLLSPVPPAREGPVFREQDVEPDQFLGAFGFRGVEFGKWVSAGGGRERQELLNYAHDALRDLADALGIPAQSIGLDGSLGLRFGATGHGRFAAHYEPDFRAINLTRTKGSGVLAHEWGHAIDYWAAGDPDCRAAWFAWERRVKKTGLWNRCQEADRIKGSAYYAKTEEVFARCFEAMVRARLSCMGRLNSYLVAYASPEQFMVRGKSVGVYPYPLPEEETELVDATAMLVEHLVRNLNPVAIANHE